MFPYKTANNIEQQERKADITYLDAQLSLKANLAGATLTGAYQFTAGFIAGENTVDLTGIDVNGTTYDAYAQVTNVGTAHEAQLILNRHSTTLPPRIIGARSNAETTAHTAVTAGQELLSLWGVGITSASGHHDVFGTMDFVVGTGAVSATSSPGKWVLKLTPDGAQTPAEVLSIDSDGSAAFAGSVTFASASFTAISLADGSVGAPSLRHTGDTNTGMYFSAADTIDFSCGGTRVSTFSTSTHTIYTDVLLSGTALRVKGVFDGAHVSRTLYQTATVNTGTSLGLIPNGTATVAQINLYTDSAVTNATMAQVIVSGTTFTLRANKIGTGSYGDITFDTGGAETVRMFTTNRVAIGISTDDTVGALQVNGKIGAASSLASSPAFYTLGDTNTGMYFSAADTIDFSCGGTKRFSIDPVLLGATSSTLKFLGPDGTSASPAYGFSSDPDTGFYLAANGILVFCTAGTDRLTFNGTLTTFGLVTAWDGGTAGVSVAFSNVNATPSGGGNLRVVTSDTMAIDLGGSIALGGSYSGTSAYVDFANISGRKENGTDGNAAGYFSIATRVSGGNTTEKVRVSSAGNIGLVSGAKIYLDGIAGTGDTYLLESAANVVDVYTGATRGLTITASGFGYATGVGGAVTQVTSKSTGVTLSKVCGAITMDAAALAADAVVSFVLTNTMIAATDVLVLNHISGGTPGAYTLNARAAAGSATIDVANRSAGSLSEAIVIQFVVVKAVNS